MNIEKTLYKKIHPYDGIVNGITYRKLDARVFLSESRGVNDDVRRTANDIVSFMYNKLSSSSILRNFTITQDDIEGDHFFDKLRVDVNVVQNANGKDDLFAGYDPSNSSIVEIKGIPKLNELPITMTINMSEANAMQRVRIMLYHELTHAYQDFCLLKNEASYSLKDKFTDSDNLLEQGRYQRARNLMNMCQGVAKRIAMTYYLTEESEVNAEIAEVHTCLYNSNFMRQIVAYPNLQLLARNLPIYERLVYIMQTIDLLDTAKGQNRQMAEDTIAVILNDRNDMDFIGWFRKYLERKLNLIICKTARIISAYYYDKKIATNVAFLRNCIKGNIDRDKFEYHWD